jgi:hypothetical protein
MRIKILFTFLLFTNLLLAQLPGDTIVVNTFNYANAGSKFTRDTVIQFPDNPNIRFSKVLMLYNMRCKDGLVSAGTAGQTNKGCGEWDYSCNTYLTDSTRTDSLASTIASHNISGFSGTTYNYVTQPYFNLYQYPQTITTISTINSETQSIVGTGALSNNNVIQANVKAGRSQYLFTASELINAGLVAGNIDGILLQILNSSAANFLEVNIKHTTQSVMDATNPNINGYTNVYNTNTTFATGSHRLQFSNAFLWDGVSNIIIDFNFTNSTPNAALAIASDNVAFNAGLIAGANNYINTSGVGYAKMNAALPTINNQITVTFWSKGNASVSTKATSIIEGTDNNNLRQLNIHMPWSNGRVYFDCGNAGAGYDRIDKQATVAETEGLWQHWAFTKNTATGVMNIFLNGTLWHTGTGKTLPINIQKFVLGIDNAINNIYFGTVDELAIFDAELSATTIANWMRKKITNTHPNYANLVAYYPLNEGVGNSTADASPNASSGNFVNPTIWNYARGNEISRFFEETMERPNITFLQGNYTQTHTNVFVLDSLEAIPNFVKSNTVYPMVGTIKNDSIGIVSNLFWHATYKYTFDALTGLPIDSVAITPTNTINITQLPFVYRYPAKMEIMSFVTPYGINLDLGINGKTWTFDMTDFLPVLKGTRRLTMERGGERQEDMDIKFLFIVGTPTRDVKSLTHLWRQPGNCNYNQIINNTYFEPRSVPTDATAKFFKTRTVITGHGQEGEFIPRQHFINVNGGTEESIWTVEKKCGYNPIFPQGGTWIYDRAGWCPGMASDLHEVDITSYITPGQNATIDYGMYTASGNSDYLVSNYLVQYGAYNYALDATLLDVLAPTNKVEYARDQAICASPKVRIQNTGSTTITSAEINYWVNNNAKSSYTWSGTLLPNQTADVTLPNNSGLWANTTATANDFYAELIKVNGTADMDVYNNKYKSNFGITGVVPRQVIVYHKANTFANETSYRVTDELGNVLLARSNLSNNLTYRDTLNLPLGCFKLEVADTDGDGISFWANSDGSGSMSLRKITGQIIKTFQPDFGSGFTYNFTTDFPLQYEDLYPEAQITIYPNPTNNIFTLEAENIADQPIKIFNQMGQQVGFTSIKVGNNKLQCQLQQAGPGVYTVHIAGEKVVGNYKLVLE